MIDAGEDQPYQPRRSLSSTPNRRSQVLRSSNSRGWVSPSKAGEPNTGYGRAEPHWVTMESPTGKRAKSGNLRRMIRQSQSCNIAVESLFLNDGEGDTTRGSTNVEADKAAGGNRHQRRQSKHQEEVESLCAVLPRKPSLPFGTPIQDVNTLLALDIDDDDDDGDGGKEEVNEEEQQLRPKRTPRRSRSFGIVGGGTQHGGNLRLSLRRGLSARFNNFRRSGSMD